MLDTTLLRTFMEVARAQGFTEAGRRLGLRQSTVSQQIGRLEDAVGRRLFVRDTHTVRLTADGEALVEFARGMLELEERARQHFAGADLRGRVRLGAGEDFVISHLSDVLAAFVRRHPAVDLELTVGLSGFLYQKLDAGELDLVLAKRRPGDTLGRPLWRDRFVWAGREGEVLDPAKPVPLVLYTPPSISRSVALESLERHGRPWRIACVSGSLSGLRAAALAGLGVTVQPRAMLPSGMAEVPHLPPLVDVEFVLAGPGATGRGPAAALAQAITDSAVRLQGAA
ncbi:LysR substrate-binding domain-containing protein [Nitrospirillum amazonense]|uniref:DNA-binding transcriptional LysR family regulator n=1 Tax=Nitrospirillum amazonense TaxID=28077 RepID=A0A560JLU5_9PROT|nr:LysR substrate-binding domain-containing protein [Nitrospirillum amazonense]MDG3438917.1 LysR substrate-binding domain-containing protein [Nitrospirillum amazonense]TWB69280.1 DNA-binding transcriptional LysR family regulator [Nitrospirillum amazonense]